MKIGSPDRKLLLAVVVMVSAATLMGCSSSSDGEAQKAPTESSAAAAPSKETAPTGDATASADACATVSAPMATIDSLNPGEPQMLIPQPAGWERNTTMDSELIRYFLANESLLADSFVPNVVVTLEKVPGTGIDPQDVLDQQKAGLETQAQVTDMSVTPTTVCGTQAEIVDYTLPAQGAVPAHPAKVLVTAAPIDGDTWSATVTVQALNADDPTYQQDAETILSGFQLVPAS